MVDKGIFSETYFPSPIESSFDRAISIGWYDGTTSGVMRSSRHLVAFRFNLVDWGPGQDLRVFALSPISAGEFELVVSLYCQFEAPNWPIWYPGWPSSVPVQERMGRELDAIFVRAGAPEYVFASESNFKTILAVEKLTPSARAKLPSKFDDQPSGGFDHWQKYLGLSI